MFMRPKLCFAGPATAVIALGAMLWMGAPLAEAHLFSSNSAMSVGWVDKSEPFANPRLKPRAKHARSSQVAQPTASPSETGATSLPPPAAAPSVVTATPSDAASATTPRASKLNDLQVVPLE